MSQERQARMSSLSRVSSTRLSMGEIMDQATAIEALRERYARGGVPLEEFRRLMGTLMVTTDPVECQALLDQLPPESAHAVDFPAIRRDVPVTRAPSHRITAMFGQVDRRGDLWDLGPETEVTAAFGEVNLDLRMARLTDGENILRLHALFGEINVIVPQGLRMFVDSQARFGEVNVPGHSIGGITMHDAFAIGSAETSSYLRIEAVATFGEVNILVR